MKSVQQAIDQLHAARRKITRLNSEIAESNSNHVHVSPMLLQWLYAALEEEAQARDNLRAIDAENTFIRRRAAFQI